MHINATFSSNLMCYEDFNEKVGTKQFFLTLACCNILSLIKKGRLNIDYEISSSWLQITCHLYICIVLIHFTEELKLIAICCESLYSKGKTYGVFVSL